MPIHKATLVRVQSDDKQTLGHLTIYDGIHKLFECCTLELDNDLNRQGQSRIPHGYYHCKKHVSPSQGDCFSVIDVPNRSNILIHKGNYNKDILGCILVGKAHTDIDGDGYRDVTSSGDTLKQMLSLTDEFWLRIVDYDEII